MANTLKTVAGEVLISEVEAIITETMPLATLTKQNLTTKVVVVGKTGIKYDLTGVGTAIQAQKVREAALNFVAGTGHTVFDPSQVNL